jgi:hypothetical protein
MKITIFFMLQGDQEQEFPYGGVYIWNGWVWEWSTV